MNDKCNGMGWNGILEENEMDKNMNAWLNESINASLIDLSVASVQLYTYMSAGACVCVNVLSL